MAQKKSNLSARYDDEGRFTPPHAQPLTGNEGFISAADGV